MYIDLNKLNELELSPNEYCVLELLYNKDIKTLESFKNIGIFGWVNQKSLLSILPNLALNGWIRITYRDDIDFDKVYLKSKAENLFDIKDTDFYKLWSMYPRKVPNGKGGSRILRSESKGDSYLKSFNKWKAIVKNKPTLPKKMMDGLDNQLKVMRDNLQYMQEFDVWLNKATWDKYINIEKDVSNSPSENDIV